LDRAIQRRRQGRQAVLIATAQENIAPVAWPSHPWLESPTDHVATTGETPVPLGWAIIALQAFVGLAIVAALVWPWVYLIQHRAPEFLSAAKADAVHHLESGSEGHAGPPGYHLALIWVTYLPWSLLLPLTIVFAFKNRQLPQIRFGLAAVLGTWVFVEILQTKLPHYILPAFPALAFLTADAIVRCLEGQHRDLHSKAMGIGAIIVALVMIGMSDVPWWLAIKYHEFAYAALIGLSAFAIIAGTIFCRLFLTGRPKAGLIAMGLASMGMTVLLFVVYLPQSQPLRLPVRVAEVLVAHDVVHPHQAVMFEYKEPSLAFYQGGTIREYNASLAQLGSSPNEPRWAVIPKWVWDQATPDTRSRFDVVAPSLVGWDYSDAGKTADVMVLRRR
jgi:4-amino-4-deoxy-L-arabinose transferase-like glycosyltransferase